MVVEMLARMTLTKTMCLTSMMCVRRTLTSVKRTSASSRWFLLTPKEHHRLILIGLSATRAKSWFRLSIAILALPLVCKMYSGCLQKPFYRKNIEAISVIFWYLVWLNQNPAILTPNLDFLLRLPWVQRSGLQWDFLHQHRERWWLCWICVWLPVQLQVLCRYVEADYTDLLVK